MPHDLDEKVLVPLRVTLPLDQFRAVKTTAAAKGVPLAVLVRRLLTAGLEKETAPYEPR
jgi:hypothetical protein